MLTKILVTGSSGFIGQALIETLLKTEKETSVVGIDITEPSTHDYAFIKFDISNSGVSEVIREIEPKIIYHLAAQTNVRYSINFPELDFKTNVTGTENVLNGIASNQPQRIVFTNSGGAMHSKPAKTPTEENELPTPESPYGRNKLIAKKLIEVESKKKKFSFANLNLSNIYGEENPPKSAPAIFAEAFVQKRTISVLGDGSATRDWVYIDDLIKAVIDSSHISKNLDLNISTARETSINSLIAMFFKNGGIEPKVNYKQEILGEVKRSALCNLKASKEINWTPKTSLESGVEKLVKYYQGITNAT
jgi:UDP-glucose 4-epimerase